jgi:putative ABC transport system ATP-binding protein
MLQLHQVTKKYIASEVETTALNSIDLNIAPGDFVAVMGPSGCGKSTLLNAVGMLDRPTSGKFEFMGEDIMSMTESRLANLRKTNLGFIFQSFNLIDELSVWDNVELPLVYQGVAAAERRQRVEEALTRMAILPRKDHMPQQLSGGQQQRVAIARAVVTRPKLLLADEPTGNLDSKNGEEVMNLLRSLNADGATILMVTHSREHATYANRMIEMVDGTMVSDHRIEASPAAPVVRQTEASEA